MMQPENRPTTPMETYPWQVLWNLLIALVDHAKQHRRLLLVGWLGVLLACLILLLFDRDLATWLSPAERGGWINEWARGLSYWGDFLTFCVPVGLILAALGWIVRRGDLKRAGLACILGAAMAGLCADAVQIAVGRPRPRSQSQEAMTGFNLKSEFHAFPSGHSATQFGSATALAVCYPPAAPVLMVASAGVAWSRLYLGAHYVSDVVAGSALGICFGWLVGRAARRPR
ncbi:MAG: phosphatase PAP2 family protein [Candidatus Methylacidiphilales bacterium]